MGMAYVVTLKLGICAVVLTDVLDRVCRPDDLCRTFLPFRRPHCAARHQACVEQEYKVHAESPLVSYRLAKNPP